LAQFALILHPDKTRLIQFGRRAAAERERAGLRGVLSNGHPYRNLLGPSLMELVPTSPRHREAGLPAPE
jgi:hypothetical protein